MYRRLLPLITESDKELPYYLVDAGVHWDQEPIVRPDGYLYQWIQCVEGEGELISGGRTFRVKEGTAMLLLKGAPHEYYAVSPSWRVNWIVFDGHQVESFLKRTAGITAPGFTIFRSLRFLQPESRALWIFSNRTMPCEAWNGPHKSMPC